MPTETFSNLDKYLGLNYYITSPKSIGGRIRAKVEDFIVEEVSVDRLRASPNATPSDGIGEYLWFILEKRNLDMITAIEIISRQLNIPRNHFFYAGIKDARAITRQFVSTFTSYEHTLKMFQHNKIKLYAFFRRPFKLRPGLLYGNWFKIKISDLEIFYEKALKIVSELVREIETLGGVPAYYGYQRFGTIRPNTHIVGKYIIKGLFEEAVWEYIARPYLRERFYDTRREAWKRRDPEFVLKEYPKSLHHERLMAEHLCKNPRDYVGALRRLPLTLRKMFIQAYQSYLFNKLVSKRIEHGLSLVFPQIGDYVGLIDSRGIVSSVVKVSKINIAEVERLIRERKAVLVGNIFGYGTRLAGGYPGQLEREILEEENLKLEYFKIKGMPEISSKGRYRHLSFRVEDFKVTEACENYVTVEFILKKGNYATVFLREIMKPTDVVASGY
ncbi:MAG: tRNA pseudouridine(13) synthase TruD [Thermoprotei archaeon]|nr:MAG: tRNA pseudouridine(13) synthase TruD [Thermoprotei archaeon]RLF00299.1 MAG: tRNA pseudouridine(13) synthase TruD [Thermoprotei archaeon]